MWHRDFSRFDNQSHEADAALAMDALADPVPVSDAYASFPIDQALDWAPIARGLGDGEWYLVVFRSCRRADADEVRLTEFDEAAHLEASSAPGFVHYFKGPLASDRSCLSFCMWTERSHARAASGRPRHIEAVSVIGEMYERYTLEFMRVTARAGEPLRFEPWDRPVLDGPTTEQAA
jgi:hypothetical protein